jgi:peptidoglycan hydrolase CwlO-like protein
MSKSIRILLLGSVLTGGCWGNSSPGYLTSGSDLSLREARYAQESPLAIIARQDTEIAQLRQDKERLQGELSRLKETSDTAQAQVRQLQEQNQAWQQKHEAVNQELQVGKKICTTQQESIIRLNIEKIKVEQELYRTKIHLLQQPASTEANNNEQRE